MAQAQQPAPGTSVATQVQQQNIAKTNSFAEDLKAYRPNLMQALPPTIPPERFERVLITAVSSNPDLLYANRRTLFNESMKCAVDGLLPDGREAALVVFRTTVKQRDAAGVQREFEIEAVKYMPMVQGIRKRMRNTGEVLTATAEVVHRGDTFGYSLGDDPFIRHEPPPLGEERGEMIGAYAIIKLKSGEILRDVMSREDIEQTKAQSRARNSLMWTKFESEGWKKTVLRRCAKAAPQSAENEMLQLLGREEEPVLLPPGEDLASLPGPRDPEPQRSNGVVSHETSEPGDLRPVFVVTDLDHDQHEVRSGERARDMILQVIQEAASQGLQQLNGIWESNEKTVEAMAREGYPDEAVELAREYDHLREKLKPPSPQETSRPAGAGPDAERPGADDIPPGGEVDASRQGGAQESATGPAGTGSTDKPASSAPAVAAAAAPAERPFPGDLPAGPVGAVGTAQQQVEGAVEQDNRPPDYTIPPTMRGNKPDWRAWTVAMFTPKMKRIKDRDQLAFFLGDNHDNLEAARKAISQADRRELEEAIAAQQKSVEETPA